MNDQTTKFLNKTLTLAAVLVVGILVFLVGQMMLQQKALDQQNTNQISVSGEGKVYAKPDIAVVNLGVTTEGATVAEVTKSNTIKMNAVIAAVKSLGIADKDIQTTNYNLSPVYNENVIYPATSVYNLPNMPISTGRTLKGYSLEQDVEVKIRDFTKIGDVLAQATTAGSNLIGDLQFNIDNPEQFKEQARAKAIAQARTSAQNIAEESGINLGKLININEGYYNPSPVMYSSAKAMGGGAAESVPAPTIQPGQQEIDVTINLTYRVE